MGGPDPGAEFDAASQLAMLRALAASVDGYVNCIDRQRRILYINRTLTRSQADILGRRIEEFIVEPHRQATIDCVERAFTSGAAQRLEYTVALADGKPMHVLVSVVPFAGPRGEELALQITTDVSESRRLAAELEQSMEFRRTVVENLPDFVALMDRERRFVWINRAGPLAEAEVIGSKLESFLSPHAMEQARRAIDTAFEAGTTESYEVQAAGGDGSDLWYSVRVVPVVSGARVENVLLISADVTERRRAEKALRDKKEQLHRAQRLESVGQLAGGIAHDFNNLLQVIAGNLAFVRECLQYDEDPTDDLDQALRATERAGELTAHLLAIGRRSQLAPKRVSLGELVEDAIRMLRRTVPENIELSFEQPSEPYFVDLDPPQFEQVLINLFVNARDAMPTGGELVIRIEAVGADQVVMSVADTGTGITPENLVRVFEPFFTTKSTGSGLGLAVASGIVGAHGGELTAESDGRSGTTMKMRLPRVAEGAEPTASVPDGLLHGSGVILVAEDEALVRAQVDRLLRRAGYTVLQAENGRLAVELFQQQQQAIDLVVLDVVMPELDGWQAFQLMQALKPSLEVLFTTGYAASVLPADFASRGARLLNKPYKRQQLLSQIRELLEQRPQP